MNSLIKLVKNFVFGLFGVILLFLFLLSVFQTCEINSDEHILFHLDIPLIHILFFVFVCLAGVFLFRKERKLLPSKYFYILILAVLLALVFLTQLWPKGDSFILMNMAVHIAEGNYQDFLPGGYLYDQPHQITMAYLCAALYKLFGRSYIFVFQAFNCFCIVGVLYLLQILYGKLSPKLPKSYFQIFSVLFFPCLLYVTFVYGTMAGLFLALLACIQWMKYLESLSYQNAFAAILLITAAKMLKSNYLIFAVGMAAVLLYDFLKKVRLRHIAVLCMLAASIFIAGRTVSSFTEHLTGVTSKGGIPAVLFVMMGFQDGQLAPGWWTGFHELIFIKNDFDVEKSAEVGKERLLESLEKMKDDPAYGAEFMLKKTASQWSEPTYESIWIQQNRDSNTHVPKVLDSLFFGGGRLSGAYTLFCNLFQSFLYFFALVFVIGKWRDVSVSELLLPVIFIGGFLFHIFWEAKGQYTLPYCICLLPMCFWGYGFVVQWLEKNHIFKKSA